MYQETEDLIFQAAKKGLGVIVRSPLNSGILTGTYSIGQEFDDNDDRKIFFSGPEFRERLNVVDKIQKTLSISDEHLLEFSLSFILSNPNVSSVIPAVTTWQRNGSQQNSARIEQTAGNRKKYAIPYARLACSTLSLMPDRTVSSRTRFPVSGSRASQLAAQ